MKIPGEFFIEDRLERYRNSAFCNLGESGIKNFTLGEICRSLQITFDDLFMISLKDSPNWGRWDLREEIARLYENVHPEQVLLTTGTSEGLYLLFHHLVNPKKRFSYLSPAFQALYEIPQSLGGIPCPVEIFDSFIIENLFINSDLVILNHPHNPTGKVLSEENIFQVKKMIQNYNGFVLFDEHYRFIDSQKELGFSGAGLGENVYATGSITKSFGVTGLRIGWVIGNKNMLAKLRSFKDYLTHTVNPISEFLTLRLLQNRNSFLKPIQERIFKNSQTIRELENKFTKLESFSPPEGGIVTFPKLKLNINSAKYSDLLMQDCSVFVLPGSDFEREGYIRVGLGEEESRFREGLERWANWDKNLQLELV